MGTFEIESSLREHRKNINNLKQFPITTKMVAKLVFLHLCVIASIQASSAQNMYDINGVVREISLDKPCEIGMPGKYFASKTDCHHYYECPWLGKQPILRACEHNPRGVLMFHPIKNVCDYNHEVIKIRPECSSQ